MRYALGIAWVSLIGLACNDGGSGGLAAWKELCPLQARFICEEEAACSPSSFAYESVDECEQVIRDGLCSVPVEILADFGGGGAFGLSDDAVECYRARVELGPSCKPPADVDDTDVLASRAVCDPVDVLPSGSGGAGASCLADFECERPLACVRTDGGICGVCTAISEGDSCEGSSECGLLTGLYCDETDTCVAYATEGESCAERQCDSLANLTCGSDSTCHAYALRGESCATVPCDPQMFLHCSATSDTTCTPIPRTAGDACPDGVCGYGLACDSSSTTCITLLGEGESCAGTLGGACDGNAGLFCEPMTTICERMFGLVGEPCEGSMGMSCWQSQCVGGDGTNPGTCTAYAREGEPCTEDFDGVDCLDYLLCMNGTCESLASTYEDYDDAGAFSCD